jgi:hypothetical protein
MLERIVETSEQGGIPLVLKGVEIKNLPAGKKAQLGQQVSEALGTHKATMLQYDEQQVVAIMDESRAVVVTDPTHSEMYAFAQISPWLDQHSGTIAATEFRSWLSKKHGAGLQVLQGAVALNQQQYPGVPMYAVVEEGNTHAQECLMQAGAEEVPMPDSMKVELKADEKPAPVKTFSLAKLKQYQNMLSFPLQMVTSKLKL